MMASTKTKQQRIEELEETLLWLENGSANTLVGEMKRQQQIDKFTAELERLEEEAEQEALAEVSDVEVAG